MAALKKKGLSRILLVSLGIPTIFFPGLILAVLLGWNWQPDLTRLAANGGYKNSSTIFPSVATAIKVLDGDTFEIGNGQSVRLVGINAPDRGEKGYEESADYLKDLIEGRTVKLEYDSYQEDQFGRLLAYVWLDCQTSLGCSNGKRMVNFLMIKKKLATFVSYKDRRALKYDSFLRNAQ